MIEWSSLPQRTQLPAALLALFLGGLGAHWFYLGQQQKAFCYLMGLVFSVLSCVILIGYLGLLALFVLCIADFITLLSMKPEEFQRRYNP